MTIAKIEACYYAEDAIAQALESERLAYTEGNEELANAYGLIAELLQYRLVAEND